MTASICKLWIMAEDMVNVVNRLVCPKLLMDFGLMVLGLEFAAILFRDETKMAMKAMAFKYDSRPPSANICQSVAETK